MKKTTALCSTLFLLSSFNVFATVDLGALKDAMAPLTANIKSATYFGFESKISIPVKLEDHLLVHYVDRWRSSAGLPETYYDLKATFNQQRDENRGYPVVRADGSVIPVNVEYWIKKHMRFSNGLNSGKVWKVNRVVDIKIDHDKTVVNKASGTLDVVYSVRRELELKDGAGKISDYDLSFKSPKNIHQLYYQILGVSDLKDLALESLKKKALPKPRLKWKRVLNDVKNLCLGEKVQSGILTMNNFLRSFNHVANKCYLKDGTFNEAVFWKEDVSYKKVAKVYPEYNELFKDGKVEVLISIQKCNDKRYGCTEEDKGDLKFVSDFKKSIKDYGYSVKSESDEITTYTRKVAGQVVEITFYAQQKPVHYQSTFWKLYQRAEIVVTNRMPLVGNQFWKVYSPKYQIVMGPSMQYNIWGRILPGLDFELKNIDSVSLNIKNLKTENLLNFFEDVVQTSKDVKKELKDWSKDTDWASLTNTLEKNTGLNAVARFVRSNKFTPGAKNDIFIDFSEKFETSDYVELFVQDDEKGKARIDRSDIYHYITMLEGDKAANFEELRANLKSICEKQITEKKRGWYFFKNCTPRTVLAGSKATINGINFAKGSYIDLYAGKKGVPKVAYLSEPTKIGFFTFKPFFEDNGGAVKFYRKNGSVKQGHLAEKITYKGLNLLGGLGTSMVRIYEDGTLQTAQLYKDTEYTLNGKKVELRGNWKGPHKVSFYPTGELECAYINDTTELGDFKVVGHATKLQGVSNDSAKRNICFHANGKLKTFLMAEARTINGALYDKGTKVTLNNTGKIVAPLYQVVGDAEYFWGTLFPKGSLYIPNSETSNPKWVRLEGPLKLKNHTFPKGTVIAFSEKGSLREVKSPAGESPRIVLRDYSITVPEGAELIFDKWSGMPSKLVFSKPIEIAGMTFLPRASGRYSNDFLTFHDSGRINRGTIGASVSAENDRYGKIPLLAETVVEFDEEGNLTEGTLGSEFSFLYKFKNSNEKPKGYKSDSLPEVVLPAGSKFSLGYSSKVDSATVGEQWVSGNVKLSKGTAVSFGRLHQVEKVRVTTLGSSIAGFNVALGRYSFYSNKVPKSVTLSSAATVGKLSLPAGTTVNFFATSLISMVSQGKGANVNIEVDGRKFTNSVYFFSSGRVKTGYLKDNENYNGVEVSSMDHCHKLRFANSASKASSCAATFYEDGTSILRAISAKRFEVDESVISAGQPVEFDEEGDIFID